MNMMEHQNPADPVAAEDLAANESQTEGPVVAQHEGQHQAQHAAPDLAEVKLALEAALLAASEPLQAGDLKKLFEGRISADTLRILLEEIRAEWAHKSIELTLVANGWRFRVKPEFQKYLDRLNPEKPPRYSRAVMETLAIIAYRQPVTRGDIEDIRGVMVSAGILKALEERGWIDVVGQKDVPGRPELFATTKKFLDDLNLRSLEELPPLHELQSTLDLTAQQALPAMREADSDASIQSQSQAEIPLEFASDAQTESASTTAAITADNT